MSVADFANVEMISANPAIVGAVVAAVDNCFAMCDTKIRPVGVSSIPSNAPGPVTGMLGVHGKVSGFITINLAERASVKAVSGFLQEQADGLDSQIVDGVGEMTNIIAGGIKGGLARTPWAFGNITVPSVIIGHNYQIAYAKGLQYVSVLFEVEDEETLMMQDRLVQVAVSLLRL